jgi:hypothetical protein
VALFLFGGATLQDFAFAIMVGIVIGAVSTIFIATPLLTVLMEREPEYRRRRGEDAVPATLTSVGGVLAQSPGPAPAAVASAEAAPAAPAAPVVAPSAAAASKRERRKQRRSSRPHGRAR